MGSSMETFGKLYLGILLWSIHLYKVWKSHLVPFYLSLCSVDAYRSWVSCNYRRRMLAQANDRSVACVLLFVWSTLLHSRVSSQLAVRAGPWLSVWVGEADGSGPTPGLMPAGDMTPQSPLLSSFLHFDSGAYSLVLELAASHGNTHICLHLQGQQHPVATCLPGSHLSPKSAPTPKLKRPFCKILHRDFLSASPGYFVIEYYWLDLLKLHS